MSERFGLDEHYSFNLEPVPPFRLDLTVWVLRRRPDNVIDRWDGGTYRRVLSLGGRVVELAVSQVEGGEKPVLQVSLSGGGLPNGWEKDAQAAVERLLGIQLNLAGLYKLAEEEPILNALVEPYRGVKPPRFLSFFETLVNAISCQQLSLNVGISLLNKLAVNFGPAIETPEGIFYGFPLPQAIAAVEIEALRGLGFSLQKARYITALAQKLVTDDLDLESLANEEDDEVIRNLISIKGIGRWSAEYFLLRGLGRTHIFPGDDVGARNNLQQWLGLPSKLNYESVKAALVRWANYGGLIYFHLLLNSLTDSGRMELERNDHVKH